MYDQLREWLNNTAVRDPIERRQAPLVQLVLLISILLLLVRLPFTLIDETPWEVAVPLASVSLLILVTALVILRRGGFTFAVTMLSLGGSLALMPLAFLYGPRGSQGMLLVLFIPFIALSGLLAGLRGFLVTAGLILLGITVTSFLESIGRIGGLGPRFSGNPLLTVVLPYGLIVVSLGFFFVRFGASLRNALASALARERELETISAGLEQAVHDRTVALQEALGETEQSRKQLEQTVAELIQTQQTVRALSAPIIPILPGVLVAPLIGELDSARITVLSDAILHAVQRRRTRAVIFDVTGVAVIDTAVAQGLIQTAKAIQLLGAQVSIVGIQPDAAQSIISLGVDFATIATHATLEAAIVLLLSSK